MLELKITINDKFYDTIPLELTNDDYLIAKQFGEVDKFSENFGIDEEDFGPIQRQVIAAVHKIKSTNMTMSLGKFDPEGRYFAIPDGKCKFELRGEDHRTLWVTEADSFKKKL